MFRSILDDTRALIADLKRLADRLSTRWQWLRLRSRRQLQDAAGDLENIRRSAVVRTRMCRECRALIPVDSRICPECGQAPGRAVATGFTRVVQNMLPGVVSATSVILTLNVAVYLISNLAWSRLTEAGGVPSELRGHAWSLSLIGLGAIVAPLIVAEGEVWRLVTMMFLHGGLLHILMNSWSLLAVGPLVEEIFGTRRFLVIYLVVGLGGSVATLIRHLGGGGYVVGASGAIFGLIGVAVGWGWRRGGRLGQGISGQMAQWAVYGLLMGFFIPNVDNAAHIGGLVTGLGLGLVLKDTAPRTAAAEMGWKLAAWLGGLTIAGSLALALLTYRATVERYVGWLTETG